jgi:hypothetical protein
MAVIVIVTSKSTCYCVSAVFRTDWHRINLKRKMKNLPLAQSEEEFNSLPISHWDVDIDNFHN